jgi:hypothetical protein
MVAIHPKHRVFLRDLEPTECERCHTAERLRIRATPHARAPLGPAMLPLTSIIRHGVACCRCKMNAEAS